MPGASAQGITKTFNVTMLPRYQGFWTLIVQGHTWTHRAHTDTHQMTHTNKDTQRNLKTQTQMHMDTYTHIETQGQRYMEADDDADEQKNEHMD